MSWGKTLVMIYDDSCLRCNGPQKLHLNQVENSNLGGAGHNTCGNLGGHWKSDELIHMVHQAGSFHVARGSRNKPQDQIWVMKER